jgi:homocitrate synthase NifV
VIGKHSGLKAIKMKMEEMNISIPMDYIIEKLLHTVKEICTENRNSLNDEEFERLAIEVIAYETKQIYS